MPAVWKDTLHHDNEAPHQDFENGIQCVPSTTPTFASVGFTDGSEQIPLGLRPMSQDIVGDALYGFAFLIRNSITKHTKSKASGCRHIEVVAE